jgi:hypothetical protein
VNISTNPWSFVNADVVTSTPAASPTGLVSSAGGVVALTTGGAHGLVVGNFVTIIGATNAAYNGFYKVIAVGSATTATLYSDKFRYAGTVLAASGGGTVIKNQYVQMVRAEDMYWLNAAAAGDEVIVLDRDGNLIWDAIAPVGAPGNYSRSKPYWVQGLSIQKLSSGTLTVTIN